MDQSDPPSAAELGLTDIEYERIMRGLRQRDQDGRRAPADARDLVEQDGMIAYKGSLHQRVDELPVAGARRLRKRWYAGLLVLLVPFLLVRTGSGAPQPEFKFLNTADGKPVTYSSCGQIRVEVYPVGGPPNAEELVREAIGVLRGATGLDIVLTGAFGGHATNWNFKTSNALRPDDPVSVSWQDSSAIARLKGDVAGLGGSAVFTEPANGRQFLGAGAIALSRDDYAVWSKSGDHADEMAVLLHEFGHVFGLAHVSSRRELMYPSTTGLAAYGPGDLEGLREAGNGPCF